MSQGFEDPGLCRDEFFVVLHAVPLFGHLAKYSLKALLSRWCRKAASRSTPPEGPEAGDHGGGAG
ncbi:hypothetical protein DESPIG_02963 [Desulfovibrio piger ATCC 29098]|uniref:Uncharacterized protein n=1 Tax=Desulfovibrio piger ATCC 29098 TaxID=411464 RepID=B6WXY4_9BACT|nr:hypothetical protein DESPIG_02963 [Desulfovibrio piger ATCC 29098]